MTPRENLAAAIAEQDHIRAQIDATAGLITELTAKAASLEGEADEAAQAELDAAAQRLVAGDAPGADSGLEAVKRSRAEAAAARHAIHLAQAEVPALEREADAAEAAITSARLAVFRADRDSAHVEVLAVMESLAAALARVLAADLVREAALGTRFSFDSGEHPPAELWQPRPMIAQMVAAIPARFRSADFGETIARAAEAIARQEVENEK